MSHPNSLDLEAFACGEPPAPEVASHLATCEACSAFVGRIKTALAVPAKPLTLPSRKSNVVPLRAAAWVVVPLAVAAAVLLMQRPPQKPIAEHVTPLVTTTESAPPAPTLEPSAAPEPIAMAKPAPSPISFKGALPIAIVRERAGDQARFVGSVSVRPDDRLRVEVALDHEETILAGVLGDDGSWLELMPAEARAQGTYFSDRSARVDASPLKGTVLVGTPAAVQLAKTTHRFDGVSSLRIDWEAQ